MRSAANTPAIFRQYLNPGAVGGASSSGRYPGARQSTMSGNDVPLIAPPLPSLERSHDGDVEFF
jgi:hypothetical protein